jgi:hypothetical protein
LDVFETLQEGLQVVKRQARFKPFIGGEENELVCEMTEQPRNTPRFSLVKQ